jgi:hypothetical protein
MFAPGAVARRSSLLPDVELPRRRLVGGFGETPIHVRHSAQAGAEEGDAHNSCCRQCQASHGLQIRDQGNRPNQRSDIAPPVSSSRPAPAANAAVTSRCSSRVAT